MTQSARETLAALALLALIGCSRDVTPVPVPEPPSPPMTPAARPYSPPATRPRCLEKFELFDRDGDGRVSLQEFDDLSHPHADPATIFRLRDANGDGFLSQGEFCSGQAKRPDAPRGQRQSAAEG
jgi:hypothetical protein